MTTWLSSTGTQEAFSACISSSSPDAVLQRKAPSWLAPQCYDNFGSLTTTYINVTSRILSAARSVKPLFLFPTIFCIHLVNKLYILLISALHGARGGGGDFLFHYCNRSQQRAVLSSCRPVSSDEMFYFGGFFFISVASGLCSSPAPLLS